MWTVLSRSDADAGGHVHHHRGVTITTHIAQPSGLRITDEFHTALDLADRGRSFFLTGKAGTGKSTLVRMIVGNTDRNTLVAAPTGIAALNVGGMTIHRLFGFRSGVSPESVQGRSYRPGRYAGVLSHLDTLIIDEASMVRADLLDCMAIALERFGPRPGQPFGGIQLILVGDLYQLPPVVTDAETEYFSTTYTSPYFFDANSFSTASFPTVQLTKVFRQEGSQELIDVLNAVRDGRVLNDQLEILNARVDPAFETPPDELWLTLTTTNRIANARNHAMLDRLPGQEHVSTAEITGDLSEFDPPTEQTLPIKVGAQIMMLTNHPSDAWVNGTLATIAAIGGTDDDPSVTIELPDGTQHDVHRHTWEVARAGVSGGRLTSDPVGTFTQLPFRLAWAITIHKSQGQTLQRAVVDLSGGTFADGQLYVALSRLTSLDGLVLKRAIVPKDLHTNTHVRRFLQTGATRVASRGRAYIGVCMVGDVGATWRPRPAELAVVTNDGQEFTTLVNPERDLGDASRTHGISAADVQLAPTLVEAWAAFSRVLGGYVPAGVDIDTTLGHLEFELKRKGAMPLIPLGDRHHQRLDDDQKSALTARTALERAQAARTIMKDDPPTPGSSPFEADTDAVGFLKPRGSAECFLVTVTTPGDSAPALARLLEPRMSLMHLAPDTKAVLAGIDSHDDSHLLAPYLQEHASASIDALLVTGARVCFSGSAVDRRGRHIEKEDLKSIARAHGLDAVDTVTKTKCDVLVTAEAGSQSGKAKTAAKWGKPVFTAKDFLAWARGEAPQTTDDARGLTLVPVEIRPLRIAQPQPGRRPEPVRIRQASRLEARPLPPTAVTTPDVPATHSFQTPVTPDPAPPAQPSWYPPAHTQRLPPRWDGLRSRPFPSRPSRSRRLSPSDPTFTAIWHSRSWPWSSAVRSSG